MSLEFSNLWQNERERVLYAYHFMSSELLILNSTLILSIDLTTLQTEQMVGYDVCVAIGHRKSSRTLINLESNITKFASIIIINSNETSHPINWNILIKRLFCFECFGFSGLGQTTIIILTYILLLFPVIIWIRAFALS